MATNNGGRQEMVALTDNDKVNELPDEILEQIFCYLPVCDAVRTSVLARKWRYGWTKFDQLNFYFDHAMELEMMKDRRSYFRMVGRVLSSHTGPIHKCVLRPVCYDFEGDMDALLQLLSIKGIKDLTIHSHPELDGFVLPPSTLERLSLGLCSFYPTEIVSPPPHETAVIAPNLRVLDIVSSPRGLCCYSLTEYISNVRVASFRMEYKGGFDNTEFNCYYILKSMPKIEVLTFDCRLHKTSASDIIPNKLPETLQNLKTVTLRYMDALSMDHISFMFCIFRSSPTLQNLNIHMTGSFEEYNARMSSNSSKADMAYLEDEVNTSITKLSLTIRGFDYAKHIEEWIALLDSMVSCCPALGELVIKDDPWIQDSAKLQLSSALKRYQLSSSKLKIIYSNAF